MCAYQIILVVERSN